MKGSRGKKREGDAEEIKGCAEKGSDGSYKRISVECLTGSAR